MGRRHAANEDHAGHIFYVCHVWRALRLSSRSNNSTNIASESRSHSFRNARCRLPSITAHHTHTQPPVHSCNFHLHHVPDLVRFLFFSAIIILVVPLSLAIALCVSRARVISHTTYPILARHHTVCVCPSPHCDK